MEILYITAKNAKIHVNEKGEAVVTLSYDEKDTQPEINYRVVHSYTARGSEEKRWRVSDKGILKTDKLHGLHITRKADSKK